METADAINVCRLGTDLLLFIFIFSKNSGPQTQFKANIKFRRDIEA